MKQHQCAIRVYCSVSCLYILVSLGCGFVVNATFYGKFARKTPFFSCLTCGSLAFAAAAAIVDSRCTFPFPIGRITVIIVGKVVKAVLSWKRSLCFLVCTGAIDTTTTSTRTITTTVHTALFRDGRGRIRIATTKTGSASRGSLLSPLRLLLLSSSVHSVVRLDDLEEDGDDSSDLLSMERRRCGFLGDWARLSYMDGCKGGRQRLISCTESVDRRGILGGTAKDFAVGTPFPGLFSPP